MTKRQLFAAVAAILTTALGDEPAPFPQVMAYLALGSDMAHWEVVRDVLVGTGHVTLSGDCIHLTEKGRDVAEQRNAALASA